MSDESVILREEPPEEYGFYGDVSFPHLIPFYSAPFVEPILTIHEDGRVVVAEHADLSQVESWPTMTLQALKGVIEEALRRKGAT